MSKRPSRAKTHPVQGDAPVIDREGAETLEPVNEGADGLMPTEENANLQKRYVFDQKAGISSLDVMEIGMMRMLSVLQALGVINPGVSIDPSVFRTVVLSEYHFSALSPQAQRQMKEVPVEMPAQAPVEPVADDTVKH